MRGPCTPATRRPRTTALAALVCGLAWASLAYGQAVTTKRCDDALRLARTTVTLHLIDRAGLPEETRRALLREAILPWRDVGVDVRWATDERDAGGDADDVYVQIARGGIGEAGETGAANTRQALARPIASILFVQGRPTTQIRADLAAVEHLAATARFDDKAWLDLPRLLRERSIGRVLGRAIAHEVGHYLFASAAHAPGGLMRAHHPIERLLTSAGAAFQVIPPP